MWLSSKFCLVDKTLRIIFIKRMSSLYFKRGATNDLKGTHHPMHHGRIIDKNDSQEECMNMGSNYVQVVVNNFNEKFPNLPMYNAHKLFNPKYYSIEEMTCINMCEH